MALSGTFEGMPPQDLFEWIARGKKQGILSARWKNDVINIRFFEGDVVGIYSSRSKDRLGAILVRKGIIDPDQQPQLNQSDSLSNGEGLAQVASADANIDHGAAPGKHSGESCPSHP